MPKRMLIDSSHPEETRVVVLDGQKVEEFDFEAASKRPLKGNIYLAKVTRVEPSLQAAFVEYGGNRQGFLAFSEIHPDYYQIPVADRMALLAEQEAEARRRSDDDVESFDIAPGPKTQALNEDEADRADSSEGSPQSGEDSTRDDDAGEDAPSSELSAGEADDNDDRPEDDTQSEGDDQAQDEEDSEESSDDGSETAASGGSEQAALADVGPEGNTTEPSSTDESGHASSTQPLQAQRPGQRWMRKRHYKIQEVIKRRQIILVQVVKEERGNKGAALTTYLSLAGRYCVLMPNTPRGGGISRKITNANDRKRLKSAAQALELPEGMGLIIRTAGENRTKVEIKRDYEYLLRMWDTIRELTLKSNAPACVYEEGDLVKRAIRDLYNKDVSEILVEGDEGYRNAKEFMRMLMPSHAKNVKLYKEPAPLFQRHHIEAQLDAMFSSTVTLKSGGYIVINQTEALVSIDVNSGRATREHSIEDTARKTNLEAADEIGRQLRLRDLAGLIVIDFIDMEDSRNDRDVEKRVRDAVKNDRARVQIGKISQFGLLEMSRQRLRAGVIAGSTVPCPHCGGQGIVRSVESTALRLLRALEEEGQKLKASAVLVRIAGDVAIYTLNQKRRELGRIENDYGMLIAFEPKDGLMAGTFEIDRTVQKTAEERERFASSIATEFVSPPVEDEPDEPVPVEEVEDVVEVEVEVERPPSEAPAPSAGTPKRRRRRRGGRGHGDRPSPSGVQNPQPTALSPPTGESETYPATMESSQAGEAGGASQSSSDQSGTPKRKRRRRRGRRGGGHSDGVPSAASHDDRQVHASSPNGDDRFGPIDEIDTTPTPAPVRQSEQPRPAISEVIAIPNGASSPVWTLTGDPAELGPRRSDVAAEPVVLPRPSDERVKQEAASSSAVAEVKAPAEAAKKGWWQRTFRSDS